jgi:hypothetical protein
MPSNIYTARFFKQYPGPSLRFLKISATRLLQDLNCYAKSPIRLNPDHAWTVFRVRLDNLKPGTTYYYTVGSEEANGTDDGVKSAVKQFTTPGGSQRADRSRAWD